MVATHVIGPRRRGTIKESTYESGVDPIGDARRRFNVRFYIVAMLFLLFHVEIVFFYPWATLFPRLRSAEYADWAATMTAAGFGPGFFLLEMALFMAILLVGYVYAWRRGVFRWD
jgi:NADH-quinone oxidoreductase subunit A